MNAGRWWTGGAGRSVAARSTVAAAAPPAWRMPNALQLLREVALVGELTPGPSEDLGAAIDRLHRAISLLERPAAH